MPRGEGRASLLDAQVTNPLTFVLNPRLSDICVFFPPPPPGVCERNLIETAKRMCGESTSSLQYVTPLPKNI